MAKVALTRHFLSEPGVRQVIIIFCAWKIFILAIACASPGPGYDTSTRILLDQHASGSRSWMGNTLEHLVLRLTRWDGIYFATSATRGHLNEQDWAFSWMLARATDRIARGAFLECIHEAKAQAKYVLYVVFPSPRSASPIVTRALVGMLISHASHFLAVLSLYHLTLQLIPSKPRIAFAAACLHILSPAGTFLSAPYGESAFAFCNFLGMLSYALAVQTRILVTLAAQGSFSAEALYLVTAGFSFGVAATIRSNGLLSGIVFAWDAIEALLRPSRVLRDSREFARFTATIAAGSLVAIGFSVPQIVAYVEYCTNGNSRPWCNRIPPSIYGWVQDHYWEVGFLRYWTLNNLPLFLIAGPILAILISTAITAIWEARNVALACLDSGDLRQITIFTYVLPRLALPQLLLALMAATSFHVQIINRISSGYPIWYILLAISAQYQREGIGHASRANNENGDQLTRGDGAKRHQKVRSKERSLAASFFGAQNVPRIIQGMVIYSVVQGGLYASFMPPA